MAKYLIQGETLTGIADAIREKASVTNAMFPEDMPGYIRSIAGSSDTGGVPDDIVTEAQRVANGMIPKIGDNAVTFIAISDMHEMGDNDWADTSIIEKYRRANLNAGQAAKIIADLVPLDFFANLGDLAWGASSTTTHDHVSSIVQARSYTFDAAKNTESFLTPGNHDVDSASGYHDPNVVTGLIGSYRYVDLGDKKVRVICLNTADTTDGTTGTERVSGEQLQWFAEALDLSGKSDASEWGIIVLSHHPIDWSTAIKPLANCLAAYLNGEAYSATHDGVEVSYDYTGKNAAAFIANFHGHVHCFKVANISGTTAMRIAIPNACFGRNNEYGSEGNTEFGETETYKKSDNSTGKNTAFCLVSIDLEEKVIYADCFGAGYDRVISYGEAEIVTYSVTNDLTYAVNSNSAASVVEGASYAAAITPDSGYEIDEVTVTMGGVDITSTAYSDGTVSIASVTGDIVITVTTSTTAVYTVTNDLAKVTTSNGAATATHGSAYSATLTADSGYSVNFARVFMGGADITADVYSDGKISIASVTGNIEIIAGYYTNQVETAQAMGSTELYNGLGYKDGYYLSSSSPFEGTDAATVLTGYIPYPVEQGTAPGTIYLKGADWQAISHCRIMFFTEAKTDSCGAGINGATASGNGAISTHFTVETGGQYTKLTPIMDSDGDWAMINLVASSTNARFLRMSLAGTGGKLIITMDEPIE